MQRASHGAWAHRRPQNRWRTTNAMSWLAGCRGGDGVPGQTAPARAELRRTRAPVSILCASFNARSSSSFSSTGRQCEATARTCGRSAMTGLKRHQLVQQSSIPTASPQTRANSRGGVASARETGREKLDNRGRKPAQNGGTRETTLLRQRPRMAPTLAFRAQKSPTENRWASGIWWCNRGPNSRLISELVSVSLRNSPGFPCLPGMGENTLLPAMRVPFVSAFCVLCNA